MLETARLLIRPHANKDADALQRILGDALTMRFWPQPFSAEQTRAWIARSQASQAERGFARWGVVEKATRTLIGDCGLLHVELNGRLEYDLGAIIHHTHWRQGLGTEAAAACLAHGFALGVPRICANMAHDHLASRRLVEKLGLRKEAEFHNARNRGILTYLYVREVGETAATISAPRDDGGALGG